MSTLSTKTPAMDAQRAGIRKIVLRGCNYYFCWGDDNLVFVQAYNAKGKHLWSAGTRIGDESYTIGNALSSARTIWSETRY